MEINPISIGIILIIIGFSVIILSILVKGEAKVGFGRFIGHFTFGFANDPQMMKWVIAITAIVAIVFLAVILRG